MCEDAVRYKRRLSNRTLRPSGAPIMPCARASKKTTTGPSEPFFKSPNLNNNAVTRESIRKMRSANFVSKFLRDPSFGFVFCRDYCLFIFRFVFLYSRRFVGRRGRLKVLLLLVRAKFKFDKTRLLIGSRNVLAAVKLAASSSSHRKGMQNQLSASRSRLLICSRIAIMKCPKFFVSAHD